jgi:hypothetical protein
LPVIANMRGQKHVLLGPCAGPDPAANPLLKLMVTNRSAADLFAPHWQPSGDAIAFTLETLEARFYHPICVWSSAATDVRVLDVSFFQPLLGTRYPQWGTTTDFVAWKEDKVLVRVYNCAYPEKGHPSDPGRIVSYDSRTGKIALER